MEKKRPSNPSNVFLFSREKLTASGVLEVTGFDELQLEAKTEQGLLLIRGHALHIESFDSESGDLTMTGRVDGLVYTEREQKQSFLARLLK